MGQPQPIVYVVRHGETTLNKQDAFRGPLNIDLNTNGWRQANALKHYFGNTDFSYVFASSKKRTLDTANKITEDKQTKPISVDNLQALNVGDLAGQEKTPENEAVVDYHYKNPNVPMPGGESFNNFSGRIRPLLYDAIKMGLAHPDPILVVAHSSVIHELGTMIGGDHECCLVEPGGVVAVYIQDGELKVEPVFRSKAKSGLTRPSATT